MIEDKELNELFRQESQEHLNALEEGLLSLERDRMQPDLQAHVMREAHSLKGAARMLDLAEIEALAHEIESQLREQIDRNDGFGPEVTRHLLGQIDQLRELSRIAVEGEAALKEEQKQGAKQEPKQEPNPEPHPPAPVEPMPAANDFEAQRIDTIRIATSKLDRLMTYSSELQVLDKRISNQANVLDELAATMNRVLRQQHQLSDRLWGGLPPDVAGEVARLSDALNAELETLTERFAAFSEASLRDSAYLASLSSRLDDSVRELRRLPLSVLFDQFRRMIRDLSADLNKPVEVVVDGADLMVDKRVIEELKDPLMHLIRNALEHGLESPEQRLTKGKPQTGMIKLRGIQTHTTVMIEVEDDGRGIDLQRIRDKARTLGLYSEAELASFSVDQLQNLIFRSGLSTQDSVSQISGRGVGLDVVSAALKRLKGEIITNSQPELGTSFRLIVPQNFATTQVTLVSVKGQTFAVPMDAIESIRFVDARDVIELEGQAALNLDGQTVSLALLEEVLGLMTGQALLHADGQHIVVVISVDDRPLALVVEQVLEEQSIVIKPTGTFLRKVRNIAGVGLLGNGDIVALLSPRDLVNSVRGVAGPTVTDDLLSGGAQALRILLAEDSMITRAQEKRILEAAGYEVIVAVDGQEAWSKLNSMTVDAVVSDIMMPNVDGFELTRRIRAERRFDDLPVLLVTTLSSDEDRKRGLDLGANAYISKGGFNQKQLLDALARLVGAQNFDR